MKKLFLFLALSPLLAQATQVGPMSCRDGDNNIVVGLGYVPGRQILEMSVSAPTRSRVYSITVDANGVVKGINGRRSETPELDISKGIRKSQFAAKFRSDSKAKFVDVVCTRH